VAGSGKSTLTRALCQRYPGCQIADFLHTRARAHWPYVAHSLPRLLPLLAGSTRDRPALSWDEIKFVIYVSEWNRFLRANRAYRSGVTVLDQGPIFALARLLWGNKPITKGPSFRAWLNEMVEHWSVELDAIVWLVAPDDVLLERIDHREQRHEAKSKPALEGLDLLSSHREAYGQLYESIARLGRPEVMRFDTSTMSPVEIAGELAEIFEPGPERRLTDLRRGLNVG
jgi:deoxyadenosine/deoxycytidine kinase